MKFNLSSGREVAICTSLTDHNKFPYEEIEVLCNYYWNKEEPYQLFKKLTGLDETYGKTIAQMKNDFHSQILIMNLCAINAFPLKQKIIDEYQSERNSPKKRSAMMKSISYFTNLLKGKKSDCIPD